MKVGLDRAINNSNYSKPETWQIALEVDSSGRTMCSIISVC